MALAVTACILGVIAVGLPMLSLARAAGAQTASLSDMPVLLATLGWWSLAASVLVSVVLAPLAMPLLAALGLASQRLGGDRGRTPLRLAASLGALAMVDVLLLGLLIAWTRLAVLGYPEPRPALAAAIGLAVAGAILTAALHRRAARPSPDGPGLGPAAPAADRRTGRALPAALLLAAALLYLPANLLPVMTVTSFGVVEPHTILGGVLELYDAGDIALAAIVLAASVCVPVMKLAGVSAMLLARRTGGDRHHAVAFLRLHAVLERIGRWSMVDVFVIAILMVLVRDGVATVDPAPGAVAFAAVVWLTMAATAAVDPRALLVPAAVREPS